MQRSVNAILTITTSLGLALSPSSRLRDETFPRKKRWTQISRADNENDIDRVANSTLPPKIENFQARSHTKENGADIGNTTRTRAYTCTHVYAHTNGRTPRSEVFLRTQTRTMHKHVSCVE